MDLMAIRRAMMMQKKGKSINLFNESTVEFAKWISSTGQVTTGNNASYGCVSQLISSNASDYTLYCFNRPYSMSIIEYDAGGNFIKRNHVSSSTTLQIAIGVNTASIAVQIAVSGSIGTYITPEVLHSYRIMLVEGNEIPQKYIPY